MKPPVFMDLNRLVQSMKSGLYVRFMRRAQKATLMEWRDRQQTPGLRARFTHSGRPYYNFSDRSQRKRRLPFYVNTGRLRDSLMRRKPKSLNTRGTDVVTVLKFGGGALNFLNNKFGTSSRSVTQSSTTVTVSGHRRRSGATSISVRSYRQRKVVDRVVRNRSNKSYAAEFGAFVRDAPWIKKRTAVLFSQIVRRSVIDRRTGGIKSSVLEGVENV